MAVSTSIFRLVCILLEQDKEAIAQLHNCAELTEWHARSGLPLKRFFNTSGQKYAALGLKDKLASMSPDEQYALLASDGMLVKRPILVTEDTVLVGFKEAQWQALLQK